MKRRSTSPFAQGATVLTVWPPETTPTLSVMPFFGSLSACSASVLCASSLIALMPASKLAPECAALPVISKRMNTPPLRPVTAAPRAAAGLGVEHRARRARVRSITGRENGEPISSSPVNSAITGAGAPPNFLIAASTKQFITRPDFMSATPGP